MLTIGDGLVSQVPALLISLAAALLVTRSTQNVDLPVQFLEQLFSRPQALIVTGGFLGILVFTSLPMLPLVTIGGSCIALAIMVQRRRDQQLQQDDVEARKRAEEENTPEERIEDYLTIDPMEMEIGVGLIRLADPSRGGDLLPRITSVRQAGRWRDRHCVAEGPDSRQYASRRTAVPNQDFQQHGGGRRGIS